jgi:serine protease Do
MSVSSNAKAVGVALGLALFVGVGMTLMIAAGSDSSKAMTPAPIDPRVVAPAEQLGRAFEMVAAHVRPCVVSVFSERIAKFTQPEFSFPFGDDFFRQFFGNQLPVPQSHHRQREYSIPQQGMGSGMILDKEGHILTNYHVVRDVDEIQVQLADKRTFKAEIVGTDPKTDVAIIKIKGHIPDDLPSVTLGDSDAMQVGDLVMAIGAPFGLQQTVTEGIISATGRSDVGIADYEDFLQTDAQINPGNSGGPLVNMHGEVIGMNTAIESGIGRFEGVGFSIPSNMIKTMLPTLIKGKTIVRGQLGVVIQEITKDLAAQFGLSEPKGALVSQVNKGSAADKAGIKVGDAIIRYDGHDVQDVRHLRDLVAATTPGTTVKIEVIRDGKTQTVSAAIGKQEGGPAAAAEPSAEGADVLGKLGLSAQTLTPDLAKQLGVEAEKGVAITDVEEGSVAALAGLHKGDVIVEADHQSVDSEEELQRVLGKAKDRDSVLLLVKRQGGSLFVVMQMK